MLKKIIAGSLSALMLTSCIGGSVKALPGDEIENIPADHIPNLVNTIRNNEFYDFSGCGFFFGGKFKRICYMSYFTLNENNKRLGEELIRRLFEAELLGTYTRTYNQLLNQYRGNNNAVRLALQEINGFVERSREGTIEFGDTPFVYGNLPIFYMENISPELLNRLRHMSLGLQRAILRLESLRSLYYLIHNPSQLLDMDIPVIPEFLPIFRPWREDKGLVAQQGYPRLFSDLLILFAYSRPNGIQYLTRFMRFGSKELFSTPSRFQDLRKNIKPNSNTLFLDNEDNREFSKLMDIMDGLFMRDLRYNKPAIVSLINNLLDQLENIYG